MPSSHLLLEEPIRMASILEPSKPVSLFFLSRFSVFSSFSFPIYGSIACFVFIIIYLFMLFFFFCRAFFLQWLRSLGHWDLNLDPLRLFLVVSRLGCLVWYLTLIYLLILFYFLFLFSKLLKWYYMWLFVWCLLYVVARFDFSWHNPDYHQETLENLKTAIKSTKKLCAVSILLLFFLALFFLFFVFGELLWYWRNWVVKHLLNWMLIL